MGYNTTLVAQHLFRTRDKTLDPLETWTACAALAGAGATLVRRVGYNWAPASSPNQDDPYLDKIVWKVLPEIGLRTGALLSYQPPLGSSIFAALRVDTEYSNHLVCVRSAATG